MLSQFNAIQRNAMRCDRVKQLQIMHCNSVSYEVDESAQPQCTGIETAQVSVASPVLKEHFSQVSLQLSTF